MKFLIAAILVTLSLLPAARAQPKRYFQHPPAGPLTGSEIIGPVRQSGKDTVVTTQQLLAPVAGSLIASAGINAASHLILTTTGGATIDAGPILGVTGNPGLNLSLSRNSIYLSLMQ